MPRTEGCGHALLTRIVVAGRANVLPETWRNRTRQRDIQIKGPVFECGAGSLDGTSERYGTRIYAKGKQQRNILQDLTVPSLAFTSGYMNSCIEIPITPKIAIASPTVLGGMPRPPVK